MGWGRLAGDTRHCENYNNTDEHLMKPKINCCSQIIQSINYCTARREEIPESNSRLAGSRYDAVATIGSSIMPSQVCRKEALPPRWRNFLSRITVALGTGVANVPLPFQSKATTPSTFTIGITL